MLQPVGFPAERVTLGMVQDPVQHRGGKHRISHHLCPVNDLFVGGKDDGTGFIGVADKCEKTIRVSAADRSVANLLNDDKLGFLDIFEPESGLQTATFRGQQGRISRPVKAILSGRL